MTSVMKCSRHPDADTSKPPVAHDCWVCWRRYMLINKLGYFDLPPEEQMVVQNLAEREYEKLKL